MSNNITALVFGSRYPYDHPTRKYLDVQLEKVLATLASGSIVGFLPPWLNRMTAVFPFMQSGVIRTIAQEFLQFARFAYLLIHLVQVLTSLGS